MFIDWLHFVANLLIAGTFIRFIQSKTSDTAIGRALAFAY